jgi:hypothetical protein
LLTYLFVHYLLHINNNFIDYNENTKKILDKYGDYKILKMYHYKENLSKFVIFLSNITTQYKYYHHYKKYRPYHIGIILVVKNSHNDVNFLKIDKMHTSININENININSYQKIKNLSIHKNKYSLKELLDITKKNMGKKNFFNWEFKKNNCEHFVKSFIKNIQKKQKKFIFQPFPLNKKDLYISNIIVILYTLFYQNILHYYSKLNDIFYQ